MREWILGHAPSALELHQVHWPLIVSEPLCRVWRRESARVAEAWAQATLIIWTSREAVKLWEVWRSCIQDRRAGLPWDQGSKVHWCVGEGTARLVRQAGGQMIRVAGVSTAEGLLNDLGQEPLTSARVLWLHAAGARPVLREGLEQRVASWIDLAFYETRPRWDQTHPPYQPDDELLFTSPSCVQAWESLGWPWPPFAQIRAIGPITAAVLDRKLKS